MLNKIRNYFIFNIYRKQLAHYLLDFYSCGNLDNIYTTEKLRNVLIKFLNKYNSTIYGKILKLLGITTKIEVKFKDNKINILFNKDIKPMSLYCLLSAYNVLNNIKKLSESIKENKKKNKENGNKIKKIIRVKGNRKSKENKKDSKDSKVKATLSVNKKKKSVTKLVK